MSHVDEGRLPLYTQLFYRMNNSHYILLSLTSFILLTMVFRMGFLSLVHNWPHNIRNSDSISAVIQWQ